MQDQQTFFLKVHKAIHTSHLVQEPRQLAFTNGMEPYAGNRTTVELQIKLYDWGAHVWPESEPAVEHQAVCTGQYGWPAWPRNQQYTSWKELVSWLVGMKPNSSQVHVWMGLKGA